MAEEFNPIDILQKTLVATPLGLPATIAKTGVLVGDELIRAFDKSTQIPDINFAPTPTPVVEEPKKPPIRVLDSKLNNETRQALENFFNSDIGADTLDIADGSPDTLAKAMARLSSATDINDKLQAALSVNSIAEQLAAIRMNSYTEQARSALGLSNLEEQIQISIQADMRSPNNPGNGTHSQQTQDLIDRKATLELNVPKLAISYSAMDPDIAGPLAASSAILKTLPSIDRLEMARERNREKRALINSITDIEAKNYAAVTGQFTDIDWTNPTDIFAAKKRFYSDKEFQKLTQTNLLSSNDPLVLKQLFEFSENPIDARRAMAILERIEADALGIYDKSLSKDELARRQISYNENIRLLKAAYSDANLEEGVVKSIQNSVNTEGLTGKAKTQRMNELKFGAKEDLLRRASLANFTADVTQWKGLNNSDPAVQMAIESGRKLTGKSVVPLDVFATQYLESNPENLPYIEQLAKLRSYIISSAIAPNNSAILPEVDGDAVWNDIAPSSLRIWLNNVIGQ